MTKKILRMTILALLMGNMVFAQSFNQDEGNPNLDFSVGDFSSWDIAWGPRTNPANTPGAQPNAYSHTIVEPYGTNWDGNAGAGNLPRVPSGLNQVARLGAPAGGGYAQPKSYSMRYAVGIHAGYPILFFQIASIMDKTHSGADNTHYRFSIKDSTGQYINQPCGGIELFPGGSVLTGNSTSVPPIGYYNLPSTGGILYQPWESVAMDLSAYIGQTVTITFEHFDCISGFHGSYDYIAAAMRKPTDTLYYCAEENTIVLRPYIPRFKSYLWSNGSTADSLIINTPIDGAQYDCTVTSYNGCTATFRYTIKAIYTTSDFSTQAGGQCNQLQFLDNSNTTKGTINAWQWTFGDPSSGTDNNHATTQNPVHIYPGPGTYTVTLTVSTNDNCETTIAKDVTVSPNGALADIKLPQPSCIRDTLYFEDITVAGIRSLWKLDNVLLTDTGRLLQKIFTEAGEHNLMLLVIGSNGCPDSTTKNFTIHGLPETGIEAQPKAAPLTDPVIQFYGKPSGSIAYLWDFGDGTEAIPGTNPIHTYLPQIGEYTVVLNVTDKNGCSDTARTRVKIMPPDMVMPNAFSPNGDGQNDIFGIVNITNQQLQEFSIFNRYGQRVFWTMTPEMGWDGTFKGNPCTTGTYYYTVRFKKTLYKGETVVKGDVLLIR